MPKIYISLVIFFHRYVNEITLYELTTGLIFLFCSVIIMSPKRCLKVPQKKKVREQTCLVYPQPQPYRGEKWVKNCTSHVPQLNFVEESLIAS